MKIKTLVVAIGVATIAAGNVFAQGTIDFQPRVAGIYDCRVTDSTKGGAACSGSGYSAQLFVGPLGGGEGGLALVVGSTSVFRAGTAAGLWNAILGMVTAQPGGSKATFQVRAWDNAGGTITSWDSALVRGKSALVDTATVLGGAGSPPGAPANLLGLTSFTLVPVPEPTTAALAGLGLAGLMIFRRRK